MMNFKDFLIGCEKNDKTDVKKTMSKLPAKHAALIKGFKLIFKGNNTLPNDSEHVGLIDVKNKTITIAASYNYGREHVLLHELAHLIYGTLDEKHVKNWKLVLRKHPSKDKDKQKQDAEEYFAHAYASTYCNNPIAKYNIPAWQKFIKSLSR